MLPSKKVLSVFVLAAALVASIIIAFGRDKTSSAINLASNLVSGSSLSVPPNPNWQNELGGLTANAPIIQAEEEPIENETTTETVSRSLIANYLSLKQEGDLDVQSAKKLINETVKYIEDSAQTAKISELELNIVADNGKQSITEYGENLGNIRRNNKPKQTKNEMEILSQAMESDDQTKINELDSVIAIYEKIIADLLKIPVPKTFVKAHLDMVNGIKNINSSLIDAKSAFNDPLKGLTTIQKYQEGAILFVQASGAINSYIKQNNIIYKQGSGGYYLLYGI